MDLIQDPVNLVKSQTLKETGLELTERLEGEKVKDKVALRSARKWLQTCLLALLSFEIIFLTYLLLSQGTKTLLFTNISFSLNDWEFVPFVNVALLQTCILIRPIAKDLFPGNTRRKMTTKSELVSAMNS